MNKAQAKKEAKKAETESTTSRNSTKAEVKAAEPNVPQLIAQLDELHKRGVLTDVEFSQKKTELLAKIS